MKKIIKVICIALCLPLCLFFGTVQTALAEGNYELSSSWVTFPAVENVPLDKAWTVSFNRSFATSEIGAMVIEKDNVFIPTEIKLQPDDKKAIILPVNKYQPNTEYSLRIFLDNSNQYRMAFHTISDESENPSNELPEKYDLRETDKLTNIKNQGSTNACWAFATTSALESVLGNKKIELDPFHLYYNTGYDKIDDIGQYITAVPYYAAWKGPVLEGSANKVPIKQVQEVLYLKPGDIGLIKEMIYKYGAVGSTIGMATDSRYWNPQTFAQYKYDDDMVNHAITLVGWDDNYPKENFSYNPPGNGAFIVQNSWGNNWGDNGYFYVSYYDKSLGYGNDGNTTNIVFSKVKDNGYLGGNYQYDELGNTASWGTSKTETFANVFEINQGNEESLEAISFYALDENTTYEAFIVEEFSNEESFESMRKIASGSFKHAGYYTVKLDEKVPMAFGQKIAVIVKITTPGINSPVAIEVPKERTQGDGSFVLLGELTFRGWFFFCLPPANLGGNQGAGGFYAGRVGGLKRTQGDSSFVSSN